MNREEILAVEPGEELDLEVALKVIRIAPYSPEPYSTDILAAWKVVDELIKLGFYPDIDYLRKDYGQGRWRCIVRTNLPRIHFIDVRKEAPEAICKAALLATLGVTQ